MNDRLDIFSLTESRERKIKSRLNLFEEVLRKCHKKIKSVSETMESKCLFVIPEYVIGMPLYNKDMCKVFLVNTLKEESFDVQFFYPNILYISWEKVARRVDPDQLSNYDSHRNTRNEFDNRNLLLHNSPSTLHINPPLLLGNGNSSPYSTENRTSPYSTETRRSLYSTENRASPYSTENRASPYSTENRRSLYDIEPELTASSLSFNVQQNNPPSSSTGNLKYINTGKLF